MCGYVLFVSKVLDWFIEQIIILIYSHVIYIVEPLIMNTFRTFEMSSLFILI